MNQKQRESVRSGTVYLFLIVLAVILILAAFDLKFLAAFILLWVIIPMIYSYLGKANSNKVTRGLRGLIKYGVIIFLSSFLVISCLIIYYSFPDSNQKPVVDYVIVLGGGLKRDRLSNSMRRRLDRSFDYLKKDQTCQVIVSGGKTQNDTIPEAEAMKQYLKNKGVKEERIIMEVKSLNTKENIRFSKKIINLNRGARKDIVVITSDFHMFRTKYICFDNGLKVKGIVAGTPVMDYINLMIREYLAFLKGLF